MDILHLIDRLEELFNESKSIPLTHTIMVNEDRMLDLIDQMRIAIPEEVKKAQQLLAQRDRILAQAQEEANRTVALAREKAEELIAKDTLVQQAQVRAEQILAQARADAEATRQDADDYVIHTLMQLESEMQRLLTQAQNGIRLLEEEKLQRGRSAPFEDGRQEQSV